jgi:hypothetical protein
VRSNGIAPKTVNVTAALSSSFLTDRWITEEEEMGLLVGTQWKLSEVVCFNFSNHEAKCADLSS